MDKFAFFLSLLIFCSCGGGSSPRPVPRPTAYPTSEPTQAPGPQPYPTPVVDLTPYLHEQGGETVIITTAEGDDVGRRINTANQLLNEIPGKIIVQGGGSIKTQVVVSHDLEMIGTYSCDTQSVWQGCILLKDNVKAEGKNATILEPTFQDGDQPAITVFQNYSGAIKNEGLSKSITVKGFKIVGRQTKTDGGVRQAISFGNCHNCAAIDNVLENISSIGIQFGGSAAEGHHALNGVATGNTIVGAAAAGIAIVNGSGFHVYNNTILKPGRVGGPGGVSGVDIETNNSDDWAENIFVYNNLFDYRDAAFMSVGSAILAQQRGSSKSGGLRILNNRCIATLPSGGLTSGIFVSGAFPGGVIAGNYVQRAGQAGMQFWGARDMLIENNDLNSVGGGGISAVVFIDSHNNVWRSNLIRIDPDLGGSASGEIQQEASTGNRFE